MAGLQGTMSDRFLAFLREQLGNVDGDRVRYYAAMRAFSELTHKLAGMARMDATGVPERMATWRPDQCARYFGDRTGVRIKI